MNSGIVGDNSHCGSTSIAKVSRVLNVMLNPIETKAEAIAEARETNPPQFLQRLSSPCS